jgi:hypothetical protein
MSRRKCALYGSKTATVSKNDRGEANAQMPKATNTIPPVPATRRAKR